MYGFFTHEFLVSLTSTDTHWFPRYARSQQKLNLSQRLHFKQYFTRHEF